MKLIDYFKKRGNLTKLAKEEGLKKNTLSVLANEKGYNIIKRKNYVKIYREQTFYLRDDTKGE